jgi:hypothetical protein
MARDVAVNVLLDTCALLALADGSARPARLDLGREHPKVSWRDNDLVSGRLGHSLLLGHSSRGRRLGAPHAGALHNRRQ